MARIQNDCESCRSIIYMILHGICEEASFNHILENTKQSLLGLVFNDTMAVKPVR